MSDGRACLISFTLAVSNPIEVPLFAACAFVVCPSFQWVRSMRAAWTRRRRRFPRQAVVQRRRRCVAIVGASHRQFRLSPLVHFFLDSGNGQRRKGGEKKQGGNESEKTKRRRRGGRARERVREPENPTKVTICGRKVSWSPCLSRN